jgi:hypothetical protein
LARIFSEQMRAQFANAGANSLRVSGQVKWAERTDLAVADDAGVGFHPDGGAVEDSHCLAA